MLNYAELLYTLKPKVDPKENFKKLMDYYRKFYIIVSDYLPSFVLGMTDCKGKIWIRKLYGYLKEKVLKHEILHNLFPNASEYEIRRLTDSNFLDLNRFRLIFV